MEQDGDEYSGFSEFDDVDLQVVYPEEDIIDHSDEDPTSTSDSASSNMSESSSNHASSSSSTTQPSTSATTSKKRSTAKKRIPRPPPAYTIEEAQKENAALLYGAVKSVADDPIVAGNFENSAMVRDFSSKCLKYLQSVNLALGLYHFAAILSLAWVALNKGRTHSTTSVRLQIMHQNFHMIRLSEEFNATLRTLFSALCNIDSMKVPTLFTQMFSTSLFEMLVLKHERIDDKETESNKAPNLTRKEEGALRYAAGYVVLRLPRKILRFRAHIPDMETIINQMKKNADKSTMLDYTKEWVSEQSRGGLTFINDTTFLLFKELEKNVRKFQPTKMTQLRDDIRAPVITMAVQDRAVLKQWQDLLPADGGETASLLLLQLLIDFYVQLRGFSFQTNIIEQFKMKEKSQQKGQKGLRKGLKQKEDSTTSGAANK